MNIVRAAGAAIFRTNTQTKDIELLLVSPYGTKYGFPKGHQEEGESLIETAKREVFEEVEIGFNILSKDPLVYRLNSKDSDGMKAIKEVSIYISEYDTGYIDEQGHTHHDWENRVTKFFPVQDIIDGDIPLMKSAEDTILTAIHTYLR